MNRLVTFVIILLFLVGMSVISHAQVYMEADKTRHRFAQSNYGLMHKIYPGWSGRLSTINGASTTLPVQQDTRLVFGGQHFWGHADFLISIPVYRVKSEGYASRVETAFRYFPWRVQKNKLRPYFGVAFNPASYQQGEGARLFWHEFPISTGLVYQKNNLLVELGTAWSIPNDRIYYAEKTRPLTLRAPEWQFSFGVKWIFDSTLSAEESWQSGKTSWITDTLSKLKRLNGFTFSIGPSSAFFLSTSTLNQGEFEYFHQHRISRVFPEFGLGYYWHKPDLQANLSFRSIRSLQQGFGEKQRAKRNALSLEIYHFFADYHGFAPFAGPCISLETLSLQQTSQEDLGRTLVRPGLIFGWDIRPNRLQVFYLRTNLRWFPGLKLEANQPNKSFRFDQLEFNFIQLVVFPGRMF